MPSGKLFYGTSETTFSPNIPIARGMLVTVLGRLNGIDPAEYVGESFDDVDVNKYYAPYIMWAAELGIVVGVGDNSFAPNASISRQDLAVILNKFAEKTGLTLTVISEPIAFNDHTDIRDYAADAVAAVQQAGIIFG